MLSEIGAGEVRLHGGEAGEQRYVVARGFVEVLPERVTILARERSEARGDRQPARCSEQLQHGEKLWNEAGEDPDKYAHANEVIAEAEAKLASAGAGKH